MTKKRSNIEIIQTINAEQAQNAGHDFYAINLESYSGKALNDLLNTLPMDKLDTLARQNERVFAKRFGFDACAAVRRKVITLSREHDLTDRELRHLKQAGNLEIHGTTVGLRRIRIAPVIGWIGMGILVFFLLVLTAGIELRAGPAWRKLLAECILGASFLGSAHILGRTCILPGQIFRRIGITDTYRL
jgi:hypothetical protein